jgi:hypothetical protein
MKRIAWIVGIVNAIAGLLVCVDPSYFTEIKAILLILSLLSIILYINHFSSFFIYQLRLIFLATIGYYAGLVKFIDPDLMFASFGVSVHTFSVGVQMYGMTSIALLGAAAGFALIKNTNISTTYAILKRPMPWLAIFWFSGFISLIVGYLSAKSYGAPVWEVAYASGESEGQLLGNLQSIGVVVITLNAVASFALKKYKFYFISFFICVYFLVFGILIRGGRLEFLAGLLALFVCIPAAAGKGKKVSFYFYVLLILFAMIMEFWGHLRATLSSDEAETMIAGYVRMFESGTFFVGTISGIASSFANIVHMIDSKVIGFQLGVPYLEYFLRTPPQFLYPDRPADLSAIFDEYGYISIGGFFEIGEAYINFGLVGVFFIPMLISCAMAYVYKRAMEGSLFFYLQLAALISVFMRGAWYQSFAYYKSIFTAIVIYVVTLLVCKFAHNLRRANVNKNI